MRPNIHFTKALVVVSLLVLVAIFTFNQIIANKRLAIFRENSQITLPPAYEIIHNAAGPGNYQTSVWLVFRFDAQNFTWLLHRNKTVEAAATPQQPLVWKKSGKLLTRQITIDSRTSVLEIINPIEKTLEFRYQQE